MVRFSRPQRHNSLKLNLPIEPRITLGIPIIGERTTTPPISARLTVDRPGCPDYLRLISDRAKASGVAFEPPYLPKSFTAYVQRNDPTQFPYTASDASNPFVGKKVLVLSGGDDPLVSWEFSDEFVKHLNVGKDGVKKVIVYPGVGHACTAEMIKETADFVWDNVLSVA